MKQAILKIIAIITLAWGLVAAQNAVAQSGSSQFTIGVSVVSLDTNAPSTPTGLTLSVVSHTRIDLSWTASTDDIEVGGYKVYRDGAFIATSTSVSYSDTGLSANTTYAYTVTAFDTSYNESGHTATSTAITDEEPEPEPSETPRSGGGSYLRLMLTSEAVRPATTSAEIAWTTTVPSVYIFRWGTTPDYELGTISGTGYSREHAVSVDGLQSAGIYFYQAELINPRGQKVVTDGIFYTKSGPDIMPPTNVKSLKMSQISADAPPTLTWINPTEPDFAGVRVVRSLKFYPTDRFDGEVVYEGVGQSVADPTGSELYYYTVFAFDTQKNYSSGSTVRLRPAVPAPPVKEPEIPVPPLGCLASTTLSLADVYAIQHERNIQLDEGQAITTGQDPVMFFIAKELFCQELKAVSVTVKNATGETETSFLLVLNRDHNFYEGSFAPPAEPGTYDIAFEFFDFNNRRVVDIGGKFIVEPEEQKRANMSRFDGQIYIFIAPFLLLFLLAMAYVLRKIFKKGHK